MIILDVMNISIFYFVLVLNLKLAENGWGINGWTIQRPRQHWAQETERRQTKQIKTNKNKTTQKLKRW